MSSPDIEETVEISDMQSKEAKNTIIVHVAGCVEKEGVVELEEGARIADAIEKAGGATLDANMSKVNLAYKLKDGQKLYVPSNIEDDEETAIVTEKGEGIQGEANGKTGAKININTATQTELETLSGIGPSMALKIIEYRTKNGEFNTIEDIKNVPGIGDAKFEAIKDEIDT